MLLALVAAPVRAEVINVDAGHFKVFLNDRPIGTEQFSMDLTGDSLVVQANSFQVLPRREEDGRQVTLQKQMGIVTASFDFDLRSYQSREVFRGDTVARGVLVDDTLYTYFHERNGSGEADRRIRPPGRVFVIDSPPMFTAFNVMCRALHGRAFDSRPLTLLMLGVGARDTVIESTVTDLGIETIRWGAKPVQARKLDFSNAQLKFIAWVSPAGLMLRIEDPRIGLRAERDAPDVKPRPKRRAG
jgi:hypothetical protein